MSPSSNEPASSFTSGAFADASKGVRPDSSAAGTQSEQPEQRGPFDSQSLNNTNAVGKATEGREREVVGVKGKKMKGDEGYESDQGDIKTLAGTVVTEGCSPSSTDKYAVAKGMTGQDSFPGPSGKTPTGLPLGKSSTHNACTSSYVVY
jgi:hypothetical protein